MPTARRSAAIPASPQYIAKLSTPSLLVMGYGIELPRAQQLDERGKPIHGWSTPVTAHVAHGAATPPKRLARQIAAAIALKTIRCRPAICGFRECFQGKHRLTVEPLSGAMTPETRRPRQRAGCPANRRQLHLRRQGRRQHIVERIPDGVGTDENAMSQASRFSTAAARSRSSAAGSITRTGNCTGNAATLRDQLGEPARLLERAGDDDRRPRRLPVAFSTPLLSLSAANLFRAPAPASPRPAGCRVHSHRSAHHARYGRSACHLAGPRTRAPKTSVTRTSANAPSGTSQLPRASRTPRAPQ